MAYRICSPKHCDTRSTSGHGSLFSRLEIGVLQALEDLKMMFIIDENPRDTWMISIACVHWVGGREELKTAELV